MTVKGKSEKIAGKITKKRFSVLQVCKSIIYITAIVSFVIGYYTIRNQSAQIEMSKGINEDCIADWKALTERGKIIQTIEWTEDQPLNLD